MRRSLGVGAVSLSVSFLALTVAACGSGVSARTSAEATPRRPAEAAVKIEGFRFAPKTLRVAPGTSVEWTKLDQVEHTVTSGVPGHKSGAFDRHIGVVGAAFSFTFDRPGTFPYFCDIHQFMRGEVVVAQ